MAALAAAGAGGGGPVPADVHFKMCKKIALLTKVVYHLNIKNEDSETAITALRRRQEEELRKVSDDAAEKIARLADSVTNNQEVKALEASLAELTSRYKTERDQASGVLAAKEREFR